MPLETRNPKLETLSVFFGDANDALARVYARVDGPRDVLTGLSLSGHVVGPFCEYAHTLPAHVPLVDKGLPLVDQVTTDKGLPLVDKEIAVRGAGQGLLAEAIVPDPCFWTPELPFLYRVQVELRRGSEVVEAAEQPLGIRWLGARGRSLFQEGKRHVVRGVCRDEISTPSPFRGEGRVRGEGGSDVLTEFHNSATALCIATPSDELCEAASRLGVLLISKVHGDVRAELVRLARWSAVGIAVIEQGTEVDDAMRVAARNLLFAEHWAADDPRDLSSRRAAPWAQAIVCDADDLQQFAALTKGCGLPILAQRRLPEPLPLAAARAACDRLQADLAPLGDFAGYLV